MESEPVETHSPQAATLLALTRLMSRWSSLDLQRHITAECQVSLDPTAVRMLYVMGVRRSPATPSVIADELHLSRPSTSKLITRMSDAGLLQREADPADKRSIFVSLSTAGRATFQQLFDAGISMFSQAPNGLSDDEFIQLSGLLTRLTDAFIVEATPLDTNFPL
ncbi:DNA-binding MarR family transcriptional regulator [Leucobacter exalbidus]|uniref:DNA-binding MarR family transcriptional regulator n=1 Tax=Leucobacter exalbidus TaxID=662960 RepID=A0A940PW90_9MICO|nr:MarR family transcriptional regulator [Leucobacter exalbidus]MBP1327395.1 DNA-binding MarR family transcriptional regulator [Leucobacter exalbidus]